MNEKSRGSRELRVMVITQGISRIIQPLIESNYEVVGIIESAPRGVQKNGLLYSISKIVAYLLNLFFGKVIGLKLFSKNKKIPYKLMKTSSDDGLESWIRDINPDVIMVHSMSQLLKDSVYSIPRMGTLNLHPSMLPEYRGPNPDFWQYVNMEMNPGVTIHYIDKGEDTGDVVFQERIHIPLGTKSPERLDKLIGEVGVSLMLKALKSLSNDTVCRIKQPALSPTSRARNISLEEHESVIDWDWPIERIWHVLRGTELWLNVLEQPKGFYKYQRWIVGDFTAFSGQVREPGVIYKNQSEYLLAVKGGFISLSIRFSFKSIILGFLKSD